MRKAWSNIAAIQLSKTQSFPVSIVNQCSSVSKAPLSFLYCRGEMCFLVEQQLGRSFRKICYSSFRCIIQTFWIIYAWIVHRWIANRWIVNCEIAQPCLFDVCLRYSPSYNLTPPICWVLIGQHLFFCSLTPPTCCNSPRKCTPVKYKKRQ